MDTLTLTEQEALAAGGILGGLLGIILTFGLVFYILTIIACWKIFAKAGEAGWKSLIPIYNTYILCRIIKINFWYFIIIPSVILGILSVILGQDSTAGSLISGAYFIFLDIFTAIKLGAAFGKSTGFKVGLVLLPHIFMLILGFGSSKYVLKKSTQE